MPPPPGLQGDVTSALLAQLGGITALETASSTTKDMGHDDPEMDGVFWHDEEEGAAGLGGQGAGSAAGVKRLMGKALNFLMLSDVVLFSSATTSLDVPPPPSTDNYGACVCGGEVLCGF